MHMGMEKSDPVTELTGNAIVFFAAYGLSYAGYKVKIKILIL